MQAKQKAELEAKQRADSIRRLEARARQQEEAAARLIQQQLHAQQVAALCRLTRRVRLCCGVYRRIATVTYNLCCCVYRKLVTLLDML